SRIHSESGAKVCAQLYDWLKFGRKWKQDIHDLTVEEIQKSIELHEKGRYGPWNAVLTPLRFTLPMVTLLPPFSV
ncbi:MAG: hypothetical protein V1758_10480, partial [Pseudomonadota bacterium]